MEEIVLELKRAAEAVESLVKRVEQQGEELMHKVEAQCEKLAARIEKITAAVEEKSHTSPSAQDGAPKACSSERKTMNSFVAKIMAEAEGAGRDPKQIDSMLNGLTIEQ